VVEIIEIEATQLTLAQARRKKADAEIGEFLIDTLPPIDFGRIARRRPSRSSSRRCVMPSVSASSTNSRTVSAKSSRSGQACRIRQCRRRSRSGGGFVAP